MSARSGSKYGIVVGVVVQGLGAGERWCSKYCIVVKTPYYYTIFTTSVSE